MDSAVMPSYQKEQGPDEQCQFNAPQPILCDRPPKGRLDKQLG